MTDAEALGLPPHAFDKQDAGLDLHFYAPARLVTHIDKPAVAALSDFYRTRLPAGARILDLMSSWVSHLPRDVLYAEVVGHGMNGEELAANPRLDRWFVRDLNEYPALPEEDDSFDAILVCVGAQYLQQPLAVFREMQRILVPGGTAIVSFSNRCFPTKAVAIWRALDMRGHAALIQLYLTKAGFRHTEVHVLMDGRSSDPLITLTAQA